MEDFAVDVRKFSVSEMHRSLFHPLATVRHRTWAGPETKETEQNKTLQCDPYRWRLHSHNEHTSLPLLLALCISSVTQLLLNTKFFSQFAARFNIFVRGRRSVGCTVRLLQLFTFERTTRLHRKTNVAVCCRNENKWLNKVKFQFPAFVLRKIVRLLSKIISSLSRSKGTPLNANKTQTREHERKEDFPASLQNSSS
jgi:hypothetical protein